MEAEQKSSESLRILMLALLMDDEYSLLPEIYSIFGAKLLIKFLDTFGGTTINVPKREKLHQHINMIDCYATLKTNEDMLADLATKYDVEESTILIWRDKISTLMKDMDKMIHPHYYESINQIRNAGR